MCSATGCASWWRLVYWKSGLTRNAPCGKFPDDGVISIQEEYRLTAMGLELHPAIIHLVQWGDRWLSDDHGAPLQHIHRGHGHRFQAQLTCADCGEVVGPRDVTVAANPALAQRLELPDEGRSPDTAWRQGG